MKLKYMLATVVVLGVLAAALIWMRSGKGTSTADEDSRTGKELVEAAALQPVDAVLLTSKSSTLHLDKDADGTWRVRESNDQPVDFSRLSRLVSQLTEAKVTRKVTESPARMERLDLGQDRITFSSGSGQKPVLDLVIGKSADGGCFFRFGETGPAYLMNTSLYLDASASSWVDKTVLDLKPEDIASVTLPGDLPGATLTFVREKADADWTCKQAPDGMVVDGEKLNRWISTLGTLRYTKTVSGNGPEVTEATPFLQNYRLTTFTGDSYELSIGQKPEKEVPPEPVEEIASDTATPPEVEPATEEMPGAEAVTTDDTPVKPAAEPKKIPAGPVVVEYTLSSGPWKENLENTAFVVPDYYYNQKPKSTDLFKEAPKTAPPPSLAPAN